MLSESVCAAVFIRVCVCVCVQSGLEQYFSPPVAAGSRRRDNAGRVVHRASSWPWSGGSGSRGGHLAGEPFFFFINTESEMNGSYKLSGRELEMRHILKEGSGYYYFLLQAAVC